MDYGALRARMVDSQIAARGIDTARVLEAMREVPRHLFVPDEVRADAYADRPLAVGEGQTISQPYIVALMTDALAPQPHQRVLEVGTGSGYQTAILARLAAEVISIERHAPLAARARLALDVTGVTNVSVLVGDGSQGHAAGAPYDRILVTAGAPGVPDALREQLAEGGRLVIPVGTADVQQLLMVERSGDRFSERQGEMCVFVPLIGRHGWPPS